MITRLKLKPGQKGTKNLTAQYGEALVCVRYRYDSTNCTGAKTVEIIVEKNSWTPPVSQLPDDMLVPVRIGFSETALQGKARAAKERWDPDVKRWFIRFGKIKGTKLEKHILLDAIQPGQKTKRHLILYAPA
jgi:hypothetical protein